MERPVTVALATLEALILSARDGDSMRSPAESGMARPYSDSRMLMTAWIYLFIAGLLEVVWAYFMKQSMGFTRLVPSVLTFGAMFASFGLLSLAMKSLPLGTAYSVWTGIGAVGAFAVGVLFLGESMSAARLLACGLIVAGLVLMKAAS